MLGGEWRYTIIFIQVALVRPKNYAPLRASRRGARRTVDNEYEPCSSSCTERYVGRHGVASALVYLYVIVNVIAL